MTAPARPLSLLLANLAVALLVRDHAASVVAEASPSPIVCRSGWTGAMTKIPPSRIDDGYCDCPHDGADEPSTGACSGAMDGMWAGVPALREPSDLDASRPFAKFACPQQPTLVLAPSRVGDGICDCCDGADEASPSSSNCADICDEVLAEERAARAEAAEAYAVGSAKRAASVGEYRKWRGTEEAKLRRIEGTELPAAEAEVERAEGALRDARVALGRSWLSVPIPDDLAETVAGITARDGERDVDPAGAASFVISLCRLSAEASSANVGDEDRCLALERASLDLGILWDRTSSSSDGDDELPKFKRLEGGSEDALAEYADQILLQLEAKDGKKAGGGRSASSSSSRGRGRSSRRHHVDSSDDDSSDDPYGDDWEDHHEDYMDDDHYMHDEEDEEVEPANAKAEDGAIEEGEEVKEPSANERLIESLLGKVVIDRDAFKAQGNVLLKYMPKDEVDADESSEESEGEGDNDEEESSPKVDPMALQMVKSKITKSFANIARGESCAKSAARYVAALMRDSSGEELKNLAVLAMYHSNISAGDIAELVYATSDHLRSDAAPAEGEGGEGTCSASLGAMCPSRMMSLNGRTYPPRIVVEAAQKRCEEREGSRADVCTAEGSGGEDEFPNAVPEGYYGYYPPRARSRDDDALNPSFASLDALHKIPQDVVDARMRKADADKEKRSLTKSVTDLKNQLGDNGKYGQDGELYLLRDTCHKIESGKYEYELCIFGKATQRDIGQRGGGTNLGSWSEADVDENGKRTLKWANGTKCWNGPQRSAEVLVSCGKETKVLTADEPETCKYVFTMESPIGCDERLGRELGL